MNRHRCEPPILIELGQLTVKCGRDALAVYAAVANASAEYRKMMQSAGFQASMSRKADCHDNAPMDSFVHALKTELVHQYATREEAIRDMFAYTEGFYNRKRSAIGYIGPIEMELKAA